MGLYLAEIGAKAAQKAAFEAEEDLKVGLVTSALERLGQAKVEIASAIAAVKLHKRIERERDKREREVRSARMEAARG